MFHSKSSIQRYSATIAAGLVIALAVVVATLVEAVTGIQTYL